MILVRILRLCCYMAYLRKDWMLGRGKITQISIIGKAVYARMLRKI